MRLERRDSAANLDSPTHTPASDVDYVMNKSPRGPVVADQLRAAVDGADRLGRTTLIHTIFTAVAPALTESTGGQGDSVSMDVAALRWLLGAVWSHRSTVGPWQ